ncbi:MAG TPA: M1 family aminopeptidase [Bacteroidales bacterium]|nr:M1 family aminopeptidase [Bacteroidales bacterium]
MLRMTLIQMVMLLIGIVGSLQAQQLLPGRTDGHVASQLSLYDIGFYHFSLEVSNNSREISGWAEIHANAQGSHVDTVVLQLSNSMIVDSVRLNDMANPFYHSDQLLKIPASIAPQQEFVVKIFYHGTPAGTFFKGIHRQYSSIYDRWVTWTFSQPFYAYKWFPCKQVHADKIDSVYMDLIADSSLTAVSSGTLHAWTQLGNGKVMYEWRTTYAINYDLVFFAVSDYILYDYYVHLTGYSDSVHITHYVYNQDYLDDYIERLDSIGLFVDYFSNIYGMYPFHDECFGLVVVPGVPSMVEDNTMVVMIDELDFGITHTFIDGNCHELTHQWFGDYVACQTYADIWLAEGFAMYGGYLGEQQFGLPGAADAWLEKTRNEALTQTCGSVFVPEGQLSDASRIYDWQLTYCKGAMLVHMIRYILQDDELFFAVLQSYIDEHGNGTSIMDDFKNILEQTSGEDFTTFFNQWYYGEGYPILDISWELVGDSLHIYSAESTTCDTTPFFALSMDYKLVFEDGDTVIRLPQDNPYEHYTLPMAKQVLDIIADPLHWILAETNIGHVGLEEVPDEVDVSVFPNPCRGELRIRCPMPGVSKWVIRVYDIAGGLVKTERFDQETILSLEGLASGVYYITGQSGDQSFTRKIILH